MTRVLLLTCMTFILIFASCSEESDPINQDNNGYEEGVYFTMSDGWAGEFSSTSGVALTTTYEGKTVVSLSSEDEVSGKDVTITIIVFGTTKGTYTIDVENPEDPEVGCLIQVEDDNVYNAISGSLTISEIGNTMGSKVEGTFNFHFSSVTLDKELNVTNGTFNLSHIIY